MSSIMSSENLKILKTNSNFSLKYMDWFGVNNKISFDKYFISLVVPDLEHTHTHTHRISYTFIFISIECRQT